MIYCINQFYKLFTQDLINLIHYKFPGLYYYNYNTKDMTLTAGKLLGVCLFGCVITQHLAEMPLKTECDQSQRSDN